MSIANVVVPLLSTFLGAAITYIINVRMRRRTYVEDIFSRAIAAAASADASVDFLAGVGRPKHLTDAEYDELQKWMVTAGLKNWATKVAEANDALAQVVPFMPEVSTWLPYHADADTRPARDVVAALRQALAQR